jgi:hypothetical protein
MAKFGTIQWVEQSNGKLGLIHRLRMVAEAVRAKAAAKRRIRKGIKRRNLEVEEILPPDSAIAMEALSITREFSAPFLFHHCLRSYFWARLLNETSEAFDDEALFIAFMLHDMGLTERYRLQNDEQQCFTLVGARMADELARRHDWTDKRANIMSNAITLHLNVSVAHAQGKEAQMVRAGSGADVAGLDLDQLYSDQIHAVCRHYPRLGMKQNMPRLLRQESEAHPDCRVAFLVRNLGFNQLITQAPMFDE